MKENKTLVISMTHQPPVSIETADWPIIASAQGQAPDQSITIRQNNHTYLVYARISDQSNQRRAGMYAYIYNDLAETIKIVGRDIQLDDGVVTRCLQKLPAIKAKFGTPKPDATENQFINLASASYVTVESMGEVFDSHVFQVKGGMPNGQYFAFKTTRDQADFHTILQAAGLVVFVTENRLVGVNTKEVLGLGQNEQAFSFRTTAGNVEVPEHLSDEVFAQFPHLILEKTNKLCAGCRFANMDPDAMGSCASMGNVFCNIENEPIWVYDQACACYEPRADVSHLPELKACQLIPQDFQP